MNRAIMVQDQSDLNFKATELRLGLPGSDECDQDMIMSVVAKKNKRASPELAADSGSNGINSSSKSSEPEMPPAPKYEPLSGAAQIVGWPPVRSYRRNNIQAKNPEPEGGIYVKVSMDGAPYLRKIDLKVYNGYPQLLKALETMFKFSVGEYSEREGYKGSEYAPAYEDKDGDLMLVGDVPWEMFKTSCKRVRIMRGMEGKGLGCGV